MRALGNRPAFTRFSFLVVLILGVIGSDAAADPLNLERGLPLEVEDAYVTPLWNREYHGFLRYNRSHKEEDVLEIVQRLELGVWYNTQFTIEAPFIVGEGKSDGYGPTPLELLYNVNQETTVLPALTLGGTFVTPTGEYNEGLDSEAKFILTKTLPGTWSLHRIHLNGSYYFNDDQGDNERQGAYEAILGYEVRLNNPLIFIADVFRKQEIERELTTNLVEVGLRYRLTPYAILSSGLGKGFGADASDFRGTVGVQIELFG
jgi:hypothetical protein